MIDTLLALIPTYGLWLIFASVAITCLAVPFPSSMLVMTAGGFAAAGDFHYINVVVFAYAGFLLGDQIAFWIARHAGVGLIERTKTKPKLGKTIEKAQTYLDRHGALAVIISRTFLSPLGPYVAYISGALNAPWFRFSIASAIGALIWCVCYSGLGFLFAGRIAELASLIGSSVGLIVAGAVVIGCVIWVLMNYKNSAAKRP